MHTRLEHLQLSEKLFRDVIAHLKKRIRRLEGGFDEIDQDVAVEERTPADQSTITALRLEICLYSLCVDWVRQQWTEMQGDPDEARRHERENFYRLMTTLAQAEMTRDAHTRSFGLSAEGMKRPPLTNAQVFTALEGTAERQLAVLIGH